MPTPRKPTPTLTLYIRGLDPGTARIIKRAAQSRGLTLPQYLHGLALLHMAARESADSGRPFDARKVLATLGLGTVTA